MQRKPFELMRDHVRDIYHAVTGSEIPEPEQPAEGPSTEVSADAVLRLFADLEATARAIPTVSERVPPFSFAPPIDAIEDERELIIEVAVPGVERDDVEVALQDDLLVVSGARVSALATNGHWFRHAEIARGPFRRVVRLPPGIHGQPTVKVERGIIQVHVVKASAA